MAKSNPNRQELLDFINETTSQLNINSKKIEDLSSGVQYLHLLHQTHPNIVKMSKVNLKAYQQYENINNLRLLASYLSQIKAPFTFQVQKVAQKNYQQNLNLLKNLYKFHFLPKTNKNGDNKSRMTSVSSDSKREVKNEVEKKKQIPKIIVKAPQKVPQKPNKEIKSNKKKYSPEAKDTKSILSDSKEEAQKIRKILIIVKNQHKQHQKVDESAQIKLNKIKKILGLQVPNSHSKRKSQNQQNEKINYSMKCEPSKSSSKKNSDFDIQKSEHKKNITKSELKKELTKIDQKSQHGDDSKKIQKKFDCQQIKQSVLKKYELRPASNRKSFREGRISTRNLQAWVNEQEQDTRYNENLLSPEIQVQDDKKNDISSRKPILRKSQNNLNLSSDKIQNQSLKKVHFSAQNNQSGRKKQTVKKNEEVNGLKISSAVKSSGKSADKNQEISLRKENANFSAQKIIN